MLRYSTYQSIYNEPQNHSTGNSSARGNANNYIREDHSIIKMISGVISSINLYKLLMVLLLVIAGFTVVGNVFAGTLPVTKQEKRVVVERGDTLWGIAANHKPDGMKTTTYIEGIKSTNGMSSSDIQAGDVITLPMY